ncbi:MAG: hypothetical protein JWR48_4573 [Mycobacterium sp.]|nr:hypothetical protein [Mycobacterium sp.]
MEKDQKPCTKSRSTSGAVRSCGFKNGYVPSAYRNGSNRTKGRMQHAPAPTFAVTSASATTDKQSVTVTYPQIQYTQNVSLNFATLTWPHVSVATLVPHDPIAVETYVVEPGTLSAALPRGSASAWGPWKRRTRRSPIPS